MEVNFIPPFILRLAGLEVNEFPKFLAKKPGLEHHLVFFPKDDKRLPFKLKELSHIFQRGLQAHQKYLTASTWY